MEPFDLVNTVDSLAQNLEWYFNLGKPESSSKHTAATSLCIAIMISWHAAANSYALQPSALSMQQQIAYALQPWP